ncbi:hypothetical protein XENTR_v10014869 [Xenopus tropicalis]|nr:hypothetical protein XENTR_v10014869 [Xenopus tropicalis]
MTSSYELKPQFSNVASRPAGDSLALHLLGMVLQLCMFLVSPMSALIYVSLKCLICMFPIGNDSRGTSITTITPHTKQLYMLHNLVIGPQLTGGLTLLLQSSSKHPTFPWLS